MKIGYYFKGLIGLCVVLGTTRGEAQPRGSGYWQQRVRYEMSVSLDTQTHIFRGTQRLEYWNNSPDSLDRIFYHLYYNAFRPGSMMDVRSRSISDPDLRVRDRILHLQESETGYQKVLSLSQEGTRLDYSVEGTVLEVRLARVIAPRERAIFSMTFEGRVPIQIRRAGRNNREGISYSMSQWYPKLAEYDAQGWHAHPYVGREFYGVWGDYDVKIRLDKRYTVAGTGTLENASEIGKGYAPEGSVRPRGRDHTWHFKARDVHDFMWAADPDYVHDIAQVPGGPVLHFFYQADTLVENWKKLQGYTVRAFEFMNRHYGVYPYEQFSVIQGGDGGMEYPMSTLITGHRTFRDLVGVTVHELIHSWYHGVLGNNESLYAWMDEGFTTYASVRTMQAIFGEEAQGAKIFERYYANYERMHAAGKEESMTGHADHFQTNSAYGVASYVKGAIFLHQLEYIIGEETFLRGMRRYYNTWKFKHPGPEDFLRVMEKVSGLELDWYLDYFTRSTHAIDYGIEAVNGIGRKKTEVVLTRVGAMPMPIVLKVDYTDGKEDWYYIPMVLMRGERQEWPVARRPHVLKDWAWTHKTYRFVIKDPVAAIRSVRIDPSGRLADIDKGNQQYPFSGVKE